MMAADSAGCTVTTVVTCEGNLSDPSFLGEFDLVLNKLQGLLGEQVKVHKLEPWNSVRVTLSIPREAALRLRQLANDGSQQLRALGILSVQVEGDQVISLRLAGTGTSEPQEIVLRTGPQDGSTSSSTSSLSQLLTAAAETPVPSEKVQFRSPNVVCPPDTIVPKVPVPSASNNSTPPTTKGYAGPFPFTSMNQAMHSNRESTNTNNSNFTTPPPPYPGKHPPVTLSSPLLVNLLQNEGAPTTKACTTTSPMDVDNSPGIVAATASRNKPFVPVQSVRHLALPSSSSPQIQSSVCNNTPSTTTTNSLLNNISSTAIPAPKNVFTETQTTKVLLTNNSITNNALLRQNSMNSLQQKMTAPILPNHSVSKEIIIPPISKPILSNCTNSTIAVRNPVPYTYPPPYPNSTRQWEQTVQPMPQLQELTPSLTDLKADLDHLLPSLEADLAGSPLLDFHDELIMPSKGCTKYLINPLTGELEPHSSSESEDECRDVFTGLPSPSNLSDEDTNSTIRPDTTDQSDSESRSCHSDSSKHSKLKGRSREKGRDSPNINKQPTEKIKLRLKLEKSEPVSPAYKVDVSFINTQQPKKAIPVAVGEELRVPPLHISLRGRNHAVISNKKKIKLNADGTPIVKPKQKKVQEHMKLKKDTVSDTIQTNELIECSSDYAAESRKLKKPKLNHESKDKSSISELEKEAINMYNLHYKEKLKERRGSDSELGRTNKKYMESNGVLSGVDKKRRLSQTEDSFDVQYLQDLQSTTTGGVLGSTNIGTVASISSHKPRSKDKFKLKENFKSKDLNRFKSYAAKNVATYVADLASKQVTLPTGEMDMEAKFKQRLMEDPDRSLQRMPHRTEVVQKETESKVDELIQTLADPPPLKDKPPEPDKCNTPDRKPDLQDKQPNRSPNSGAQGEDSGIESMDALSEKSPNQASQSPHAEITDPLKNKSQVPDILDIEAQLAKMEGLHGDDLNENHNNQAKLDQCCVLTSALQESLNKGTVSLTQHAPQTLKEQMPQVEVTLVPLALKTKTKDGKEEELDPLPMRVTPPLYTYSNPEKRGSESPSLSDSDSNSNPIRKSLLEQLLIEIPENQTPSSPSPATRSVRTRASSKMNSPELLSSPVISSTKRMTPTNPIAAKRKRNESDSSNNSLEDQRNKKPRKSSENSSTEMIKSIISSCAEVVSKTSILKKKMPDESSDSDEPLIEVAGKARKNIQANSNRVKLKSANTAAGGGVINTRRSIRTIPALNTRSKGDKSNPDSDVIRRKTRSAVSEGEGKRRKDVK